MTVRGPIAASDLGITLTHEHLLADSLCWLVPPRDAEEQHWADRPIEMQVLGLLRRNPLFMRDNLLLDDQQLAAREAERFRDAGGRTIVETSSVGLGRNAAALRTISVQTGLHIVAGCGYYVEQSHPTWLAAESTEALRDRMLSDIELGIDGTDIRAGIIGELGTNAVVTADEARVLRAGAMAQRAANLAVTVHMGGRAEEARRVLDILEGSGADLSRVILDHMDDDLSNLQLHAEAARRGAYIEYDAFGAEWYFDSLESVTARDTDRIAALLWMAERDLMDHMLIAQDVWLKQGLRAFGGLGYDHILRSIVPALLRKGATAADIRTLLVVNPARALSGDCVS